MSALTKPLIHSTTVISGQSDPVNIEKVSAVTTNDVEKVSTNNAAPKYEIIFHFHEAGHVGTPGTIVWRYATSTARDTAFAAILTLASTAV